MSKTFIDLLTSAKSAKNASEVYAVVKESGAKLDRNRGKIEMMHYMPGRAADAAFFSNKFATWAKINAEIIAIWTRFAEKLSTAEIVAIIER